MVAIDSFDGLALSGEVAGAGPSVLFVHANGFCKELWRPVSAGCDGITAVAIDQRGHGGSGIGSAPYDWWDLARDALAWVEKVPGIRVGVGHSSGGAALAMAEILQPGTFDALVLIEPIVFPPPYRRNDDHPLVTGALRRRREFASRADTRAAYQGRGPFARWTDAALDLYVEHGFRDTDAGARTLGCPPEVEAEFYRMATAHGAWERLAEVRCLVTLVVGEHSDSHPEPFAQALAARFPRVTLEPILDASHFVPMERPEVITDLVRAAALG